jgi:peptide/nickel transport system substrate-binding protein
MNRVTRRIVGALTPTRFRCIGVPRKRRPSSSQVEGEIAAWFDAKTLDAEKTIVRRLNKAALDHVVYAPIGFFLVHQAWRRNVSGIVKGPLPFFWGVNKTV